MWRDDEGSILCAWSLLTSKFLLPWVTARPIDRHLVGRILDCEGKGGYFGYADISFSRPLPRSPKGSSRSQPPNCSAWAPPAPPAWVSRIRWWACGEVFWLDLFFVHPTLIFCTAPVSDPTSLQMSAAGGSIPTSSCWHISMSTQALPILDQISWRSWRSWTAHRPSEIDWGTPRQGHSLCQNTKSSLPFPPSSRLRSQSSTASQGRGGESSSPIPRAVTFLACLPIHTFIRPLLPHPPCLPHRHSQNSPSSPLILSYLHYWDQARCLLDTDFEQVLLNLFHGVALDRSSKMTTPPLRIYRYKSCLKSHTWLRQCWCHICDTSCPLW